MLEITGYSREIREDDFMEQKQDISKRFLDLHSDSLQNIYHLIYWEEKLIFGRDSKCNPEDFEDEARSVLEKIGMPENFSIASEVLHLARHF